MNLKLLLLETKDKSTPIMLGVENEKLVPNIMNTSEADSEWLMFGRYHHIYLIDPEAEIKEDSYAYNLSTHTIVYVHELECKFTSIGSGMASPVKMLSKVVASTDSALKLPQLSSQAIKFLVDYYNENSKMPDEVEVKTETIHSIHRCCMNCANYKWSRSFKEHLCKSTHKSFSSCDRGILYWEASYDLVFGIELNTQGTVDIIIPEAKMYTKEEVKTLCKAAIQDHCGLTISNQPYNDKEREVMEDKWIKKNIK